MSDLLIRINKGDFPLPRQFTRIYQNITLAKEVVAFCTKTGPTSTTLPHLTMAPVWKIISKQGLNRKLHQFMNHSYPHLGNTGTICSVYSIYQRTENHGMVYQLLYSKSPATCNQALCRKRNGVSQKHGQERLITSNNIISVQWETNIFWEWSFSKDDFPWMWGSQHSSSDPAPGCLSSLHSGWWDLKLSCHRWLGFTAGSIH